VTSSGLARRVKGAQLPAAEPLQLRHDIQPAEAAMPAEPRDAGYRRGDIPADREATGGNGNSSAEEEPSPAKDVYSFLSSFTAGVQRGLDEARRNTSTSEDDR
jgi:hypothetical protein